MKILQENPTMIEISRAQLPASDLDLTILTSKLGELGHGTMWMRETNSLIVSAASDRMSLSQIAGDIRAALNETNGR